jgi:hypothetical protein
MFQLTIATDNAAFEDDPINETVRIVKDALNKLKNGEHEGSLRDANGHTVGTFTFEGTAFEDAKNAAQELYEATVARLDATYTLAEPGQGDGLSDDQIRVMFKGEYLDDADPVFGDWEAEVRDYGTTYVVENLLDEEERDMLDEYGLLDDLRLDIQNRDDSDIAHALAAMTGHKWMRYRIDFAADSMWGTEEDDRDTELRTIAATVGIDFDTYRTQLLEMSENASEGGQLQVLWYGSIEPLVNAAWSEAEGRTITWSDTPSLLIFNSFNGSGWMCDLPGATITLPWNRDNLRLDTGNGSWSEWVCGGLYSDTNTDVTITDPETTTQP